MRQQFKGSKPGRDHEASGEYNEEDIDLTRYPSAAAPFGGAAPVELRSHDDPERDPAKEYISGNDEEKQSPTGSSESVASKRPTFYPEGGLEAWLVVLASFSGMLICFGMMNTISTFEAYVANNQLAQYTQSTIAWIFSVYVFLAFFCGIQIGPVFDRYGPRWLMLSGCICCTSSMMFLSISTRKTVTKPSSR